MEEHSIEEILPDAEYSVTTWNNSMTGNPNKLVINKLDSVKWKDILPGIAENYIKLHPDT